MKHVFVVAVAVSKFTVAELIKGQHFDADGAVSCTVG